VLGTPGFNNPPNDVVVSCTVTVAASVTNKQPVDPGLLEPNAFWKTEIQPYWRTGKLMKFTAEATRSGNSEIWASAMASGDALSKANAPFDAMRTRIWNLYSPGALDFYPRHLYQWCVNVRTGVVRAGSTKAPDFILEEASP